MDGINASPIEYLIGEYLHLVVIYLVPKSHITTIFAFFMIGGTLASLNHTRYDVNLVSIYFVKAHDVHHRLPESNYGQYIMLWDWLFGSFRAYSSLDCDSKLQ